MRAAPRNRLPESFWERVKQARHRLVVVDYDGTLAPFKTMRDRAVPMAGVVPTLLALAEAPDNTVAVISGRPLEELYVLLAIGHPGSLDRLVMVGEHGWESCCGEELWVHAIPVLAGELLGEAERGARQMGFGKLLERKRASIALHTRGLSTKDSRCIERACAALWSQVSWPDVMRLDGIDGGLELRAKGRDKGTAVIELVSEAPPGTLLLYVGDDETDEDAFRVLRGWGVGLRVARGPCRTAADGTLASCVDVALWLGDLRTALHGGSQPPGALEVRVRQGSGRESVLQPFKLTRVVGLPTSSAGLRGG